MIIFLKCENATLCMCQYDFTGIYSFYLSLLKKEVQKKIEL